MTAPAVTSGMPSEALRELSATLEELKRRQLANRIEHFKPYPKQEEFFALGATHRERLLMAGNQCGKSLAAGFELAYHLTGRYPEWWRGHKFTRPIRAWSMSVTAEATRDNMQRILLGPLGQRGTGTVPADAIGEIRAGRGVGDVVDTCLVMHKSGYPSHLGFKSYERGREKLQGETIDIVHCDEEPPMDIYSEALARIAATRGRIMLTFTPLLGATEVVRRFLNEESPDRAVVRMSLEDAQHFDAEDRKRITAGYSEHERNARTKGEPMLGSGAIFPVAESLIVIPAIPTPDHWPRICGIDFGWQNFAATWLAWDRDADIVYLTDEYASKEQTPVIHAAAIKARGHWPVSWPHDGYQTGKADGAALRTVYQQHGLPFLREHAQFEDGSSSVEAGLLDMLDRMRTGRWKVFEHLTGWREEYRGYHRDNGKVVKAFDHLLDASRYAVMMLRHASIGLSRHNRRNRGPMLADGLDYDVLDPERGAAGSRRGGWRPDFYTRPDIT